MNNKVIKFPGVKESVEESGNLRAIPFIESYLMRAVIDDLILDYAKEIVDVFDDIAKGKAEPEQLNRILLRAQYACYLRGIYDERKGEEVLEPRGMPKRPDRIAPAQRKKTSR